MWAFPDNIDVDAKTGDVWIGQHPLPVKGLAYMDDPERHLSPSQVCALVTAYRVSNGIILARQEEFNKL